MKNNFTPITIYTRSGTYTGRHVESRCAKCQRGFWHGFHVLSDDEKYGNLKYVYDDNALEQKYLVTTEYTAVEVRKALF